MTNKNISNLIMCVCVICNSTEVLDSFVKTDYSAYPHSLEDLQTSAMAAEFEKILEFGFIVSANG